MTPPKPLPGWPRLLPRELAAAYCGVAVNTFLAHVPVACVRIGTKPLYDRHAIDEWLDRGSVPTSEEWLDRA
jgi:hypothetical protein